MKTLNYVRNSFLLTIIVVLTSCGDKYYNDEFLKNSDEKLCRTTWMDRYINAEGDSCIYTLFFRMDGWQGKESLKTYKKLPDGKWDSRFNEATSTFYWKWVDDTMEGLILDYVGSVSYFDNVWVREHYLSGVFDGEDVTFIDIRYYD